MRRSILKMSSHFSSVTQCRLKMCFFRKSFEVKIYLNDIHKVWLIVKISTLWNKLECYRGFEDMKDEISSSLKASDIFGLIFY